MTNTTAVEDRLKRCGKCKQHLPVNQFSKTTQTKDKLYCYCKACTSETARLAHSRLKADPVRYAAYLAKERDRHLKRKFGISSNDYDLMLASQGEGCAICGATECSSGAALAVDHCHRTGKVRGILCRDCNTSLGKFNDDRNILLKAVEYLDRAESEE
jgi:hypothetical protein